MKYKWLPGFLFIGAGLCFIIVALLGDRPGPFVAIGGAQIAVGCALLARANAMEKARSK